MTADYTNGSQARVHVSEQPLQQPSADPPPTDSAPAGVPPAKNRVPAGNGEVRRVQLPPGTHLVRVLNVRVLAITIAAVVVIVPVVYFWHAFQMGRIGETLLARAEVLANDEQWSKAAGYMHRYLQLQPEDTAVRVRMAKLYDRSVTGRAGRERAINLYYQAIGVAAADEQAPLRARLSELLLEHGRYAEAQQEAGKLLQASPQDAASHRVYALAALGKLQMGKSAAERDSGPTVGAALEAALLVNPGDMQLAAAWADILRKRPELLSKSQRTQVPQAADRVAKADATINRMVAANPDDPLSYITRDRYRTRYDLEGAEQDRLEALKRGGERADVVQAAAQQYALQAEVARQRKASDEEIQRLFEAAIQHYRMLAETLAPQDAASWLALGELLIIRGQSPQAIQALGAGIERVEHGDVPLRAKLAEQLIAVGQLAEAEQTLRGLDQAIERIKSVMDTKTRLAQERTRDLLQATLDSKQGQPLQALTLAAPITTSVQASDTERYQAWLVLGDAYSALGVSDRAAAALESAERLGPGQPQLQVAAGLAWLRANQPGHAGQVFERAGGRKGGDVGLYLARAWLAEQAALPAGRRDWSRLEQLIGELAEGNYRDVLTEPWWVDFLRTDYALARIRESAAPREVLDRVLIRLRDAEQHYAHAPDFWLEAARRYEQLRRPAEADRALAECHRLGSASTAVPLITAMIYAGRKQYARARQVLQDALSTRPAEEHGALRPGLIQILMVEGQQQAEPRNLAVLQQLVELELEARNWEAARGWEERLCEVEGSQGSHWRYLRARRLLGESNQPGAALVQEVAQLQAELQQLRPQWSHTHLLRGSLEEFRGDFEAALQAYQTALKLGEQRAAVCERVVRVLYRLGRLVEANEYLSQLESLIPGSPDLSSLAISLATELKDLDRAESLAKRAVTSRPEDPMSWLSYGLILNSNGHTDEAEQAFRKSLELAPVDIRAWIGLFSFYARTDRAEQARQVLEQLAERAEAPPGQRAFVLAQCYATLGDTGQAETKYREAVQLEPDSVPVRAQWTRFLMQHERPETEAALRELVALAGRQPSTSTVANNARRTLATHLARRGNEKDFEEAMRLVEQSGGGQNIEELDKRLQAIFLSQRPNPDLDRAERLLEELLYKTQTGLDTDHLLLASVYLRQGERLSGPEREKKLAAVRREFEAVCLRPTASAEHLLVYLEFLLNRELWMAAGPSLQRLENLAPDDPRVVLLRARWLAGRNRSAEIQPLVEAFAKREAEQAADQATQLQLFLTIGSIYVTTQQYAAAEIWYRKAMALDPSRYALVASVLLSQGRSLEAVELCAAQARELNTADAAVTLANVLVVSQAADADIRAVEPILLKALADYPDQGRLAFAVANLRAVEGRNAEAVEFYRQVLRLQPQDAVTMNNLATLLAENSGNLQEALQLIDRAVTISGQQAALMDTKAMILVQQGRPDEALPLLREAAATPRPDPRYHFHLAVALHRTGYVDQARSSLHAALENGLDKQILTGTDRGYLQELLKVYPPGDG